MMAEPLEMDAVFDELLAISGSEGAFILSFDGYMMGSKFKNSPIKPAHSKYFLEFMSTVINITAKVDFGDPEQIVIQGTERKIFIQKVKKRNFYIVYFGSSKMNTGFASIAIEKVMPLFEKLIP